ncbi:MAG TPA: hypothetical protein VJQ47_05340 [Steroidobacteraceae bacterium]|nr:hypothetical protein [Steroidobacteraceae bacterium]
MPEKHCTTIRFTLNGDHLRASGHARYCSDVQMQGMLHGAILTTTPQTPMTPAVILRAPGKI